MPRPTVAQIRPVGNPILNGMLVAYMNDDASYIARRCAPVLTQDIQESGTYITLPSKHMTKDSMKRRAYGDPYAQGGYTYGSDTYKTEQWALETAVPDEHEATAQGAIRLVQGALAWLAEQSNIRKEKAFADAFFTTSVWGTDNTSATDWDDSSGVPVTNCGTARRTIRQATGHEANAIAMGEIVYDALKVNAEVTGLLKYTNSLTVTQMEALLAQTLGFEHLFVGKAVYNSANTGQTESLTPFIDDDALVFRVMPGPDMYDASAMKTFAWLGGGGEGTAGTYYDDSRDATMVKSKEQWDQKLISSSLGYFFSDVV